MQNMNWVSYRNGNYRVFLDRSTGTKIRLLDEGETEYLPQFAESCDILISTSCENNCPWCYAGCTSCGCEPNLLQGMLDFPAWTEIAININTPLHPQIQEFCQYYFDRSVIINGTVNQLSYEKYQEDIDILDYLYLSGLGISYVQPSELLPHLLENEDHVLHVIAGLWGRSDHEYLSRLPYLPKILILGYKETNRGQGYLDSHYCDYQENFSWLYNNLSDILDTYPVVSFDNKALDDLQPQRFLSSPDYQKYYMGGEGSSTFALNLVDRTYARSSQEPKENYQSIANLTPLQMFQRIRYGKESLN